MGLISKCFESHLDIFIAAQEKNLSELLEEFIEETKRKETKHLVSSLDANKAVGMLLLLILFSCFILKGMEFFMITFVCMFPTDLTLLWYRIVSRHLLVLYSALQEIYSCSTRSV